MCDTVINIISLPKISDFQAAIRPFLNTGCRIVRERIDLDTNDEWRDIILPTGLHEIEEFLELDFNKILPMPDSIAATLPAGEDVYDPSSSESVGWFALLEENLKSFGHEDWYNWSFANWGCKWGTCDCDFAADGKSLKFCTEYHPPIAGLKKLSKILQTPLFLEYDDFEGSGTIVIQIDGSEDRTYNKR